MPPLDEMLKARSLKGFESVENPPSAPPTKSEEQSALNPYLRCPLPPFSTTVDTIRQWNMTGKLPVMRVIPLPTQQGAGGGAGTTITNVTTTTSGGGSSSSTVSLSPASVLVSPPFLSPGDFFSTVVRMSKSFQLLQISSTQPLEIRLYSNSTTQSIDQTRVTDLSVAYDQIEGVITDLVLDSSPFQWTWENRVGSNGDSPQTVNIYVTIVNPSTTTGTVPATVTITYLPLES